MESPLERLEDARAAIHAAGGVIVAVEPLAHPTAPHTLVAHRVLPGLPSHTVADAVAAAVREHEVPIDGLVPWVPEPVEVVEDA